MSHILISFNGFKLLLMFFVKLTPKLGSSRRQKLGPKFGFQLMPGHWLITFVWLNVNPKFDIGGSNSNFTCFTLWYKGKLQTKNWECNSNFFLKWTLWALSPWPRWSIPWQNSFWLNRDTFYNPVPIRIRAWAKFLMYSYCIPTFILFFSLDHCAAFS